MKKYIALLLILISTTAMAQPPVLNTYSLANPAHENYVATNGSYFVDTGNERNQYVGTWQYSQNGVLFQLKLEKKDQHLFQSPSLGYHYVDIIAIKYRLVKNGVEVFNNLNAPYPEFVPRGIKHGWDDYLNCSFIDYTRNVMVLVLIKKLQGQPEKISFELKRGAYSLLNPIEFYNDGQPLFNVPTEPIEMVKIN